MLRIISGSRALDSERERSPEARDFAEEALVRLALAMGPHSCKLVIRGFADAVAFNSLVTAALDMSPSANSVPEG